MSAASKASSAERANECAHTHARTFRHKRAAEINELVEPQRRGIATHTHAHTHAHAHTLTHIYTHAHKRAAGINRIAEPDASAAVYPALFCFKMEKNGKNVYYIINVCMGQARK